MEHVGSTAVPGLIAKPIIDLDAVLGSPADLPEAIRMLRSLGYVHEGDLGIKGREAFLWPPGEVRHHLYVLVEGATELRRHIAFRDALRRNPALREGYAQLKRALAAEFPCDRKSYTEGKSAFIAAALDASSKLPSGEAAPVTNPVSNHYENLLGPIYSWMIGDVEAATARADAELEAVGLPLNGAGTAIDLGAGFGMHSLPLARRGYEVIAIDNYQPLLAELRSHATSLPIRTVVADLLDFKSHVSQPVDIILCMGDTLTQLVDVASVEALFDAAAAALVRGGVFALTFRDYVSAELLGDARFILVRSDENRILTCFLEYSNAGVRVHDVLHERVSGQWHLRLSSYPKLRLSPEWVVSGLISRGFTVRREAGLGGMVRVIARR